jgi:hypothetical protein
MFHLASIETLCEILKSEKKNLRYQPFMQSGNCPKLFYF